jgi:hypothetical protein
MHPGNLFQITGGFKGQRETIFDVMSYCVDEMLPRHRSLDITVDIGDYEAKEGVMGQCLHVHGNEFFVDIDSKQNLYNLILTTCHEMVHVKQYARKELTEQQLVSSWKGKIFTDARCFPWEREAWDMQKPLAHKYIRSRYNKPIKVLKELDKRFIRVHNNGILKE